MSSVCSVYSKGFYRCAMCSYSCCLHEWTGSLFTKQNHKSKSNRKSKLYSNCQLFFDDSDPDRTMLFACKVSRKEK